MDSLEARKSAASSWLGIVSGENCLLAILIEKSSFSFSTMLVGLFWMVIGAICKKAEMTWLIVNFGGYIAAELSESWFRVVAVMAILKLFQFPVSPIGLLPIKSFNYHKNKANIAKLVQASSAISDDKTDIRPRTLYNWWKQLRGKGLSGVEKAFHRNENKNLIWKFNETWIFTLRVELLTAFSLFA